ncbi:MAG: aminotransferase class V-fold PLP-dependent enzyme, partial [Opitutaceae bacterium]|nr:aminotransferase class V-fold PLP-dependent enzyme [Opitutaceae bacterium]
MKVPFLDLSLSHKPLREEFLAAWSETLDGNRFCLGQDVFEFEKAFATACGADEAVGVNNGTSALHLAALGFDLGPDDGVIVPAFTFIASAWTARYVGAKLVFADVKADTFTLDPKSVESQITSKTKAIVVVHLFGQAAEMDELIAIAKKHDILLIEDCAQSHLATYKGRPVGMIGDVGTFSFY